MDPLAYNPSSVQDPQLRERLAFLKENRVPLYQVVTELDALFHHMKETKRKLAECFVELGSAAGGSAYVLSAFVKPGGTIIMVDEGWTITRFNRPVVQDLRATFNLTILPLKTFVARRQVADMTKRGIDYLHIDADHRYEAAQSDWANYHTMVRPGGLVQLHDVCLRAERPDVIGVSRLWADIKKLFATTEFIDTSFVDRPIVGNVGIGLVEIPEELP